MFRSIRRPTNSESKKGTDGQLADAETMESKIQLMGSSGNLSKLHEAVTATARASTPPESVQPEKVYIGFYVVLNPYIPLLG